MKLHLSIAVYIREQQEGVSFKLEIASSVAMMGRKLGARYMIEKDGEFYVTMVERAYTQFK